MSATAAAPAPWVCCPRCHGPLTAAPEDLVCSCGLRFARIADVPALIDPDGTLFEAPLAPAEQPSWKRKLVERLPSLSWNPVSQENYRLLARLARELAPRPRILSVGGGNAGKGMDEVLADPGIDWVQTDVYLSGCTDYICDGHQLPFRDKSFDAVVVQAVLEHVLVPRRVVQEIRRVLRPGGLVYSETPFLQQVHAGAYDFTRFTHLGHRYLFREFEDVTSGPACGPAMAFAWAWQSFLLSFPRSQRGRLAMTLTARFTAFWLKYLDRWLIRRPGAYDGASSYFFLGRKTDGPAPVDGHSLIAGYRGPQRRRPR